MVGPETRTELGMRSANGAAVAPLRDRPVPFARAVSLSRRAASRRGRARVELRAQKRKTVLRCAVAPLVPTLESCRAGGRASRAARGSCVGQPLRRAVRVDFARWVCAPVGPLHAVGDGGLASRLAARGRRPVEAVGPYSAAAARRSAAKPARAGARRAAGRDWRGGFSDGGSERALGLILKRAMPQPRLSPYNRQGRRVDQCGFAGGFICCLKGSDITASNNVRVRAAFAAVGRQRCARPSRRAHRAC